MTPSRQTGHSYHLIPATGWTRGSRGGDQRIGQRWKMTIWCHLARSADTASPPISRGAEDLLRCLYRGQLAGALESAYY